jgi:formylglycine-generating enzyme required for sulfatase activity
LDGGSGKNWNAPSRAYRRESMGAVKKKIGCRCAGALVMALALMVSGCVKVTDPETTKKAPQITAFKITEPVTAEGVIDQAAKTITVAVPAGTTNAQLAAMKAQVTHNGTSITPAPEEAQDYSGAGKEFTVTGAGGSTKYTVYVNPEQVLALTSFEITEPVAAQGIIDEAAKTVVISYDSAQITAEQIGALKAKAVYSGQEILPDPEETRSYAEPVEFTIKGGGLEEKYTVTVKRADLSGLKITAFTIANLGSGVGTIDETALTITVAVPANKQPHELKALTAQVDHTGTNIEPDPAQSQDYSSKSKQFVIKDADGNLKPYTVKLENAVPVELVINTNPAKMSYTEAGADIELDGIDLKVTDSAGGEMPVLAEDCTFSPAKIPAETTGIGNDITVTITHTASGLTASFTVKANIIPAPDKKPYTVGAITFNMNKVNAGSFLRQLNDEDPDPDDVTTITNAYRMGEFEVTNELFEEVMGKVKSGGEWGDDGTFNKTYSPGEDKRPVGIMSFYLAIAFCNKLSARLELTPVYTVSGVSDWAAITYGAIPKDTGTSTPAGTGNADWNAVAWDTGADGFRLPTEMEFVWAAIGADALDPGEQNDPGDLTNCWAGKELGLALNDCANHRDNGGMQDVGKKAPNVLGIYDLNGNAGEIIWDRGASGAGRPAWPSGALTGFVNNPAESVVARMVKGGSGSQVPPSNLYNNDAISPPHWARWSGNGFRVAINETL